MMKMQLKSSRQWLIKALRQSLAGLSQQRRQELAADLGILPVFNIHFVESDGDGRLKEAKRR
jgi:hypothetical protein